MNKYLSYYDPVDIRVVPIIYNIPLTYTQYRTINDFLYECFAEMYDSEFPICLTWYCKVHGIDVDEYYKTLKNKRCSCGKYKWYKTLQNNRRNDDIDRYTIYDFDCSSLVKYFE